MLKNNLLKSLGEEKLYVDDVFSAYIYNGNGSTQTITNGIDLAGKGGMVWVKPRNSTENHFLFDTTRGTNAELNSNTTDASATLSNSLTAFNNNGFGIGSAASAINTSGSIYASWTFRNAPKFFTHTTKSHTTGTASTVDLSSLGTVGMVILKRIDTGSNWFVWHRSLGDGTGISLNSTATSYSDSSFTFSGGTTLTIASAAGSGTYVIYAWAHDTASDGMVQCGSTATNGSGVGSQVTLGWEPQFLLIKSATSTISWQIADAMRGRTVDGSEYSLQANTTAAEANNTGVGTVNATGFTLNGAASTTYIYLAIRIPNKPPTSGTEVFQPTLYTGTNVDNRLVNTGIKTDMAWFRMRSGSGTGYEGFVVGDRLRGQGWLKTGSNQAETGTADGLDQQIVSTTEYGTAFSAMNGVWVGNNTGAAASNVNINANTTANNHIVEAFKRAPGFMDIVCYTHTGSVVYAPHQLGVRPELIIYKTRSAVGLWAVNARIGNNNWAAGLYLEQNIAGTTGNAYDSLFTPSQTYVGSATAGTTGVAYLFASLPGISSCFSYTGNGTSQNINCGFASGSRFVLIKRTDSTGDWYVWDSARGIVAGNDPHLSLNTTAAEVTTGDSIDPTPEGFTVNQNTATNINVLNATYIGLAIA